MRLQRETSEPGTSPRGWGSPARHFPGFGAVRLQDGEPIPQFPSACRQGCQYLGRQAAARLREIAADHIRWGRRMAYRVLLREGWRVNHKRVHRLWGWRVSSGSFPESRSGGSSRRRLCPASPGRTPASALGDGLPVQRHRRWSAVEVPECARRVQLSVPGDPRGPALQRQRCVGRARRAHQPVSRPSVHPLSQRP
jgi:hypothetical protein